MKIKASNNEENIVDKIYYISRAVLIVGLPLVIVSGLFLSVFHSSADNGAVDNVVFTVPSSCTLSSNVTSAHEFNTLGGTYRKDIGTTVLKAVCNDNNGFAIYTIGSSNGTEGNNKLVSSIGQDYDIASGIETSGNLSKWSMKLDTISGNYPLVLEPYFDGTGDNDQNSDGYAIVPEQWTKATTRPSGTDTPVGESQAEGSSMTTTYAAYITSGQPAGTYIGQVKYALLHPSSSTQPTTLSQAYKNAGKTKIYTKDPITGDSGYFYTMQDMTTAICNATNVYGEASQTQLVDIRDGKLYWATKLHTDKDNPNIGQCWMTENLDLDLIADTEVGNYVALTSENTDLNLYGSMGYTSANGYSCENSEAADCSGGTIKWVPVRSTIAPDNLSSATWPTNNTSPYSYDSGAITPDGYKNGHGYSGNYYNWPATIASNAPGSYSGSINAANSICPAGWRPPNAMPEEKGYEFSKLLYAYEITTDDKNTDSYTTDGFNRIISEPLYFLKSGDIYGGTLSSLATVGTYWYSTSSSSLGGNFLYFDKNHIGVTYYQSLVGNGGSKRYGFSLRCLAR